MSIVIDNRLVTSYYYLRSSRIVSNNSSIITQFKLFDIIIKFKLILVILYLNIIVTKFLNKVINNT